LPRKKKKSSIKLVKQKLGSSQIIYPNLKEFEQVIVKNHL
jgi:hypothetical protein